MAIRSEMQLTLWVAMATVALDQLTKWVVIFYMPEWSSIRVTDFFNLVHIRNRGAAFGMLNNPDLDWPFWLFLGATALSIGVVVYLQRHWRNKPVAAVVALSLIVGGAIGNAIDRIRFRNVVDFLDFHVGKWHWPAFNVADIAICCGAGGLCLLIWKMPDTSKASKHTL